MKACSEAAPYGRQGASGAPTVRIFAGNLPKGDTLEQAQKRVVAATEECCAVAEKLAVPLPDDAITLPSPGVVPSTRRESGKMAAWIRPKTSHKHMVQRLLQVRAHLILCFRAEEKVEMVKDAKGKMQIVPKQSRTGLDGWIPVCEKNLPFELTASFLLTADAPYTIVLLIDLLIAALFAASLHFIMGPGGMHSFGHAAYFGLGAYAAGLLVTRLGVAMEPALIAAPRLRAHGRTQRSASVLRRHRRRYGRLCLPTMSACS